MDYKKLKTDEETGLDYHFDYTQEGPILDGARDGELDCSDNCENLLFLFYSDREEDGIKAEDLKPSKIKILTEKSIILTNNYENQYGVREMYRAERTIVRTLMGMLRRYKEEFGEDFDFEKVERKKIDGSLS